MKKFAEGLYRFYILYFLVMITEHTHNVAPSNVSHYWVIGAAVFIGLIGLFSAVLKDK